MGHFGLMQWLVINNIRFCPLEIVNVKMKCYGSLISNGLLHAISFTPHCHTMETSVHSASVREHLKQYLCTCPTYPTGTLSEGIPFHKPYN